MKKFMLLLLVLALCLSLTAWSDPDSTSPAQEEADYASAVDQIAEAGEGTDRESTFIALDDALSEALQEADGAEPSDDALPTESLQDMLEGFDQVAE